MLDQIYEFRITDFELFNEVHSLFLEYDEKTKPEIISETLSLIKTQLLYILNKQTVLYAQENKLYPLNKSFLP